MLVKGQANVRITPLHLLLAVLGKWKELLLEGPVSQPPRVWASWVTGLILGH